MTARPTTAKRISATALAASLRSSLTLFMRRLRATRPVGELSPGQFSVLGSLDLAGAMTPRELADSERVRPPTITKIVGRLEQQGLVQRTPHPTDGRQQILSPTDQGRALVKENRRAREAWLAKRLAELTPDERATLKAAAELLERIARA
ncbi:MAG: MarR family winged helix-turn-helix transcriptional regulator [Micromonosporaceae bacterium]